MAGSDPILPVTIRVPGDLARLPFRYRFQVVLVLARLFLFVLIYLALLAGAVYMLGRAIWPSSKALSRAGEVEGAGVASIVLRVMIGAVSTLFVVFLLKGLLKRQPDKTSEYLEITDRQQPELFQFIQAVCQKVGSTFPARVFINHEVNAAVIHGTSILSLVVPPRKHLLLGLGLVGNLNLVEFAALLAHEFGHFSQRRTLRLHNYVRVAERAVHDLVNVHDRWDEWVLRWVGIPLVSSITATVYALVEVIRVALAGLFNRFVAASLSLSRQMEFNADLVAVSVTGSDAPVQVLLKCEFCQASLDQAAQNLALAADYKLVTRDLFVHQERAAAGLREQQQNPDLGRSPALPDDPAVAIQIFQPADTSAVAMWSDHPSHYEREQNAKQRYFRSPNDDRSTWLLFRDAQKLREEATNRFYETVLSVDGDADRADPEDVEAFLAYERTVGTFDSRYHGIYDGRFLEVDDFDQLIDAARKEVSPAPDDPGITGAEPSASLLAPWTKPEFDRAFLARHDTAVFAFHYQRSQRHRGELCGRYRFHLELEQFLRSLQPSIAQVESVFSYIASGGYVDWAGLRNMNQTLRTAGNDLAVTSRRAAEMPVPPLKYMTTGEPLATYLPALPSLPDLEAAGGNIDMQRLAEANQKLQTLLDRVFRIHWTSLTAILTLQEQIAGKSDENESEVRH